MKSIRHLMGGTVRRAPASPRYGGSALDLNRFRPRSVKEMMADPRPVAGGDGRSKLEEARDSYNDAVEQLAKAADAIEAADDKADKEAVEALEAAFDTAEEEVKRTKGNLERLERIAQARKDNPVIETDPDDEGNPTPRITVGREELTYREDGDYSFFRDLMAAGVQGDFEAAQRLSRHNKETADYRTSESDKAEKEAAKRERRDVTTGDPGAGGFVPPIYLADLWVGLPRGGRVFADRCREIPLPDDGMTLTIPKVQSGTSVASQDGEGTAVSETDADSQVITAPVRTISGQNDLSIQAVERTNPGFDQIVMEDLVAAYDERLDTQLLHGTGANGQHAGISGLAGINSVAYTDGTPSAAEALPKLYDAIQRIESGKVGMATDIFWSPRRSAWFASNLSSTFPLFQLGNLVQAIGTQDTGMANNVTGVNASRDPNIATNLGAGTNEDEIFIANMMQIFLAEGELRTRALPEVLSGTLQVRFQVYAFSAFIPHRLPAAISKVGGTGLVTPVF